MLISRVHIRLIVRDGDRSIAFYAALLGSEASKREAGNAVFELDSPPLVLTLEWQDPAQADSKTSMTTSPLEGLPPRVAKHVQGHGNRRSQTGPNRANFVLVVNQPEQVGHAAIALRRAGIRLRLEDQGIEVGDPDGNTWRVRFVPTAKSRAVVAA